jgi:enterochelin esterase family protein
MGGLHTWAATTGHPGVFGYIGVWSAGTRATEEEGTKLLTKVKEGGVKLYYVGCGLDDKLAFEASRTLIGYLKKTEMKNFVRESPGGHTWFNWRIYLSEFAPMLFR